MRNRYLDLLRAVAITRVVVYHVTGWSVLTIVFPAMPVMFALAGSLMAASLDKAGISAIGRRLRRLLPSLWALSLICVPAMLLTGLAWSPRVLLWLLPLQDPPANEWGAQALSANWYLRDFLWFVILSPAALWLFRRLPLQTLAIPYTMLLFIEFARWQPNVVVRDIALYFGAWLLGFAHHDGMFDRLGRKRLLALAGTLATTGAWYIYEHPGPRGYDLNDIHLGNALWAGAFILVALGCAPDAERFEGSRLWWHRPVTVLNSRALTIYLWHVPILTAVTRIAEARGWHVVDGIGIAWRLAVVLVGVAFAVALFGWVEDVAGRRRPVLLPGARRPRTPEPAAGVRPAASSPPPADTHPADTYPADTYPAVPALAPVAAPALLPAAAPALLPIAAALVPVAATTGTPADGPGVGVGVTIVPQRPRLALPGLLAPAAAGTTQTEAVAFTRAARYVAVGGQHPLEPRIRTGGDAVAGEPSPVPPRTAGPDRVRRSVPRHSGKRSRSRVGSPVR